MTEKSPKVTHFMKYSKLIKFILQTIICLFISSTIRIMYFNLSTPNFKHLQADSSNFQSLLHATNGRGQKLFENNQALDDLLQRMQVLKRKDLSVLEDGARTLLCITSKNLKLLMELTLEGLKLLVDEGFDILIVDDGSIDGITERIMDYYRIPMVITKKKAKGLTDSWNLGYQYFKQRTQYENIIFSNNDVLIPPNAIKNMIGCLDEGHKLCKPLGTRLGVGDRPNQSVKLYLPHLSESFIHDPLNYMDIQSMLEKTYSKPYFKDNQGFNGFFFGLSRKSSLEAEFKEDVLFDPQYLNVQNEADLIQRLSPEHHTLCLTCFVFHWKNLTLKKHQEMFSSSQQDPRQNHLEDSGLLD